MLTIDESRWPLVVMTATGAVTSEDTDAYLAGFDRCLARREPFAVVLDFRGTEEAAANHGAAANRHMTWINGRREQMRASCRGIAYVLPPFARLEDARATVAKIGDRMWGCAVTPSQSLDDGVAWAAARLATTLAAAPPESDSTTVPQA